MNGKQNQDILYTLQCMIQNRHMSGIQTDFLKHICGQTSLPRNNTVFVVTNVI